jgi:mRNA interferase MazF
MSHANYYPDRGDVVWLDFDPQAGHEQAGRRPALVLSPQSYNRKTSLLLLCPITSKAKGYPFEVAIPDKFGVNGVVLSDQVKSMDWVARRAEFCCKLPADTVRMVLNRVGILLE